MSPEDEKETPEKEFADNTTLHGLNRIVIAPSNYFRVMWVLTILASYSGFTYMLSSMIMDYFSYDTITDTKLKFTDSLPFPAVTICNMNKFDAQKLKLVEWSYLSPYLMGAQYDTPTLLSMGYKPDETVNSTIGNITLQDFVRENGFDVNSDRMAMCFWKAEGCTYLNFTHSYTFFGNCYTFNSNKSKKLWQKMEGWGNGLMVFVDIRESEYTENYFTGGNSEIGLKVLVHDQDEPPMMDTQGIALSPGSHAFISVQRTVYENHVPPWGVCEDRQLEYYDTYTLPACYQECRSKHIVANCSCVPFFLPGKAPPCNPGNISTCVRAVLGRVVSGELKCDCPVPCHLVKYSTSVSYAGWPNRNTRNYITKTYGHTKDYMAENGVVFSVFYEQLSYQKIRELKAMDGGQLASNIGGMMGLFIGASLLTILEVWEYLWQRLKGFLGKHRHPRVLQVHAAPHAKTEGMYNGAFNK
ncbi:acid-sensing ion channel 1C-like [Branchiostoma floridae x Branchiostoma japonicum]